MIDRVKKAYIQGIDKCITLLLTGCNEDCEPERDCFICIADKMENLKERFYDN